MWRLRGYLRPYSLRMSMDSDSIREALEEEDVDEKDPGEIENVGQRGG